MSDDRPQKITYIGKIDYRNKQLTFGIKEKDRTKHTYIIGKSGMGKSTLLENFILQDVNNGEGLILIDPHGSTAEKLLDHIPESRIKDVVYFAPFDGEYPMGLNMLEKVPAEKRYLLANGMMSAFKKIFTDGDGKGTFSARMEYVLNNIILALLENEDQTLLGVNRMLFDKEYRKFIVSNVTDPTVRDFWVNEYANYTDKTAQELAPAIQNKIGQFVSNPLIRNIIGQKKTSFDVRKIMDEKKVLIVNLSKGKVGEGNANLLGSLLITKIYLAAMSRADIDPYLAEKLPPCYFYVDEFQNFANESFASILSEARKYKLALTVAHQYIEQMTDEVKSAVFGNVGTMITFRVGATDAEVFEKEFAPYFVLDDFVNLSAHQIYIRLMIDAQGSKPFSAKTLEPIQQPAQSHMQAVIAYSRTHYAKQKFLVEEEILEFYKPSPKVEKKKDDTIAESNPDMRFLKVSDYRNTGERGGQYQQNQSKRNDAYSQKTFDTPQKKYDDTRRYGDDKRQDFVQRDQRDKPVFVPRDASKNDTKKVYQQNNTVPSETKETSTQNATVYVATPPAEVLEKKADIKTSIQQPQFQKNEKPQHVRQPLAPQTFDDRPAISLKEALARALEQNNTASTPVLSTQKNNPEEEKEDVVETKKVEIKKKEIKEVAEDVLRKLIEE